MNRYLARVTVASPSGRPLSNTFWIEASNIRVAATRALEGYEKRDDVAVSVRLAERDIVRERIEKFSHGKATAAT